MTRHGSKRRWFAFPMLVLALSGLAAGADEAEEAAQQPAQKPVVGTLLGEPLRASSAEEARGVVLDGLLAVYGESRGIAATGEELEALLAAQARGKAALGLTAEQDLTAAERRELDTMQHSFARALIRAWKVNRALYDHYGGRLVYQQLGPEPLDAYRAFLRERQQAGDFRLADPALEAPFWSYFEDAERHVFLDPQGEEALWAFVLPPWERDLLNCTAQVPGCRAVSGTGVHFFSTARVYRKDDTSTGYRQYSTDTVELDGDLAGRVLYHPETVVDESAGTLVNTGYQVFSGTVLGRGPVLLMDDSFRFRVDLKTGETTGAVRLAEPLDGSGIRCWLLIRGTGMDAEGNGLAGYRGSCQLPPAVAAEAD
jgi:hypothetical protein